MSASMSEMSAIERVNKKCEEAKRLLDKPVKVRKDNESRWGGYISEYHMRRTGKIGSSIPRHDQ